MRRPRVLDTNVYIAALHAGDRRTWARLVGVDVWTSTVVLFELLAGARSSDESAQLLHLFEASRRQGRLLVPTEQDWIAAGQLLERHGRRAGKVGKPGDHVGDVLIALAAARIGAEVVTANLVDFRRWARALRQSGREVRVSDRL